METAIILREHGGPEKLVAEAVTVGDAGPGELRVRHRAISVNFHDTYVRTGQYRTLALPGIPGIDAIGIVEQVGTGVSGFQVGDRIAYIQASYGAYSSARLIAAANVFKVPDGLDSVTAASTLLRGATVAMLVEKVHAIRPGDHILVQAAAGGVGRLLCTWAHHLGARVIGTVGSVEKAEVARAAGADHIIYYREEDVAERVRALTDGRGVDVVYDSCGQDTFAGSLASLDYCGELVIFGQSSGPIAPFAPSILAERSLSVSRPLLFHYMRGEAAHALMERTFDALENRIITPVDAVTVPLADASQAHRMIEDRAAQAIVLVP